MKRRNTPTEMQISEHELRAMTAHMNEMHEATFPQMRAAMSDLGAALRKRRAEDALRGSRRRFLLGSGGLVVGTMFLSACGDDDEDVADTPPAPDNPAPPAGDQPAGEGAADVEMMRLNASIENLAVFAYGAALEAAPKGKFGKDFPAAVAEFASHAMKQHAEHADAFNAAVTNAGGEAMKDPTPALAPVVTEMFGKIKTVPALAMLALTLENTAGATYVAQMEELMSADALAAVSTIAPVERQHAAILSYVLGEYPIPDTFVKLGETDTSLGARSPSDLTAA
ncbi:MAG: ferritin-like domain-containing protein [Sporichthyaceae bacterium]